MIFKKINFAILLFICSISYGQTRVESVTIPNKTFDEVVLLAIEEGFDIDNANPYTAITSERLVSDPAKVGVFLLITKTNDGVRVKALSKGSFLYVGYEGAYGIYGKLWQYLKYFENKVNFNSETR